MPVPGSPISMLIAFAGRPPPRTASRRGWPLERRSLIADGAACEEGALPEQVLDGRDELQRVEWLLQKRVGAGSNASSRASSVEIARQAGTAALLQTAAQRGARSAGDEQFDDGELRQVLLELARRVVGIERDTTS